MIPIKLEMQGIYSYKEKTIIDFKRLMRDRIFGIFGETGSGKSSIIEAMIFALYGKVERLGSRDKNDLLNLTSNSFYVDFMFEQTNGNKNNLYRIIVSGTRSKNDSNIRMKRIIYRYENEWIVENRKIEDIIGIDYENFRRIIVIPQGNFQEILSLEPRDRAEMMEKLFNLDKYDLYEKAKQMEEKNNENISKIEGQYNETIAISIPEIPFTKLGDEKTNNEIIRKLNEKKDFITKKIEELSKSLEIKEKEVKELEKNKEIIERKKRIEEEWKNLQKNKEEYEKRKKEIENYKNAKINFSSLIEQIDAKENEKKEKCKILKEIESKKKEKENEKKNFEERFEIVKRNYEKRDEIKQKIENLKKIREIRDKENELEKLQKEYKKRKEDYLKTKQYLLNLKKKREIEIENLNNIERNISDRNVLTDINVWFIEHDGLLKNIEKNKNKKAEIEKNIKKLEEERENKIKEFIKRNENNMKNFAINFDLSLETKIKEKISEKEKQSDELLEKINELSAKCKLEEYAKNLKPGSPCILCGSLTHPNPLNIGNVKEMLENYRENLNQNKKQIESLKKIDEDFRHLHNSISEIDGKYKSFVAQIKNLEEELKKDENNIMEHDNKFIWKSIGANFSKYFMNHSVENYLSDKQNLEIEIKNADELNKKRWEIKQNLDNIDKEIKVYEEKEEKEEEEISKKEKEIAGIESVVEAWSKEIPFSTEEFSYYKNCPYEKLSTEISELEKIYQNIEKEYSEMNEKINEIAKNISELKGLEEANKKDIENIEKALKNFTDELNNKILKLGYKNVEEIKKILELENKIDIKKEEEEIENFTKNLHNAEKNLAEISKECEGKFYDENEYKKILTEIQKFKEDIDKNNQEIGKIQDKLKEVIEKIGKKKELEKELEKLNYRKENIKKLKRLFEGKGFVNFVSLIYLKNLCRYANKRFYEFTNHRLELDIDETNGKNEIVVRDLLNGGKIRGVDSLSGGEKFLASLSLSLSMAESVQSSSNNRQNFFFIDEGFGSLDKNSLSEVMRILKNLTKENLTIGIISHVEYIMKEMDNYLKVEKDKIRGSLIKESWKF